MYVPYYIYGLIGFIDRRKNDLTGITDGGEQPSQRISGKLAGEIKPVDRFVEREFRRRSRKDEEYDIGIAPDLADNGVFGDKPGCVWAFFPNMRLLLYIKDGAEKRGYCLKFCCNP